MTQTQTLHDMLDALDVPSTADVVTTSYQNTLRVIGAVLDELEAEDVTVIEGPGNFTVRFSTGNDLDVREVTHIELLDALRALREGRTLLGSVEKGYYQDLLRAIGYEMERVGAHNLLLSEAGQCCLLSFVSSDPTSVIWRKRHVVLTPESIAGILHRARGRRLPTKLPFKITRGRKRPSSGAREPEILRRFRDPEGAQRMANTVRSQPVWS